MQGSGAYFLSTLPCFRSGSGVVVKPCEFCQAAKTPNSQCAARQTSTAITSRVFFPKQLPFLVFKLVLIWSFFAFSIKVAIN